MFVLTAVVILVVSLAGYWEIQRLKKEIEHEEEERKAMKLKDYRSLVIAYNHMSSNDPKRKALKKQIDEEFKKKGGK